LQKEEYNDNERDRAKDIKGKKKDEKSTDDIEDADEVALQRKECAFEEQKRSCKKDQLCREDGACDDGDHGKKIDNSDELMQH